MKSFSPISRIFALLLFPLLAFLLVSCGGSGMQLDEDWRIHFKAKRYEKAEAVLKEVLKKDTGWVGPDHRFVAVDNIGLGRVYMAQKRYKEAEPHLLRGLAIYEKLYGMDHPSVGDVASALTNVGTLHLGLKRFKKAEESYLRAIPMYKKALQGASPAKYSPPERVADPYYKETSVTASMATNNLFGLAKSYFFQNQYKKAKPLFEEVLGIIEKRYGPKHSNSASPLRGLAMVNMKLGNKKEAATFLMRAEALEKKKNK